jgi:hypothetical protein
VPVPKPPARTAAAEQVQRGSLVFQDYGCLLCHGAHVMGARKRVLGGGVPDLRYMPAAIHEEWHGIVLDGNRRPRRMASKQRAAPSRRPCAGVEVARSGDSRSFSSADSRRTRPPPGHVRLAAGNETLPRC